MKINILMPTYNDANSIEETLNSLKYQTYHNWHLIIINDGSTDNTESILKKYIADNNLEEKITYIYKENGDQLNALKYGFKYIKDVNSLIYILHSDDLLNDEFVLENVNNYFKNNNVDAIMADLNIINENSQTIGVQKVANYHNNFNTVALQGLWLGRNLYVDICFWQYQIFKDKVFESYLTWNTPQWLDYNDLSMLNIKKVDFKFLKYRVFSGNYINNEIGLLNVLNGEIRNALNIFKRININNYKLQYIFYRISNKLHLPYFVIYQKRESKKIYQKVKFIIEKRIAKEDINKYPYYSSILNFFKNYPNSNREIIIKDIPEEAIFYGADMRKFNTLMLSKKLPNFYYNLFKEMNIGFREIKTTKKDYKNLIIVLKFMDIYNYVKINLERK